MANVSDRIVACISPNARRAVKRTNSFGMLSQMLVGWWVHRHVRNEVVLKPRSK